MAHAVKGPPGRTTQLQTARRRASLSRGYPAYYPATEEYDYRAEAIRGRVTRAPHTARGLLDFTSPSKLPVVHADVVRLSSAHFDAISSGDFSQTLIQRLTRFVEGDDR
jgi:hypothetical protein